MLVRLKLRDGPLDLVGGAGQFPQKKICTAKTAGKILCKGSDRKNLVSAFHYPDPLFDLKKKFWQKLLVTHQTKLLPSLAQPTHKGSTV